MVKFKNIYYSYCRIIDNIQNIPRRIKWFIQRGSRGFADNDVWNLDYYLADVIYNSLKQLKETQCGYPATYNPKTKKYDNDEKRWNKILDDIVKGFKLLFLICEEDGVASKWGWGNKPSMQEFIKMHKDIDDSVNKQFDGNTKTRILTEKEEQQIDLAFELFRKHFRNLWD